MTWGNRLFLWCTVACLLALATAANSINDRWLVPSGDVVVDHTMLNRETPLACALTFDDGPDEQGYTLEVQRILDQYGIKATFFLIGRNMVDYPAQVSSLRDAGHEIGNHSYSHPDLTTISREAQGRQVERTNAILASFGIEPRWFRPPYGAHSSTTLSVASQLGVSPINWSVDPRDWTAPGVEVIQRRVLDQTGPGAVILLHSTNAQTVAALPGIIEGLQRRGYEFLTLTEWSQLISGNRDLEELTRAPRQTDPQWEQFFQPFMSETIETVVTLPEEEREPVNLLRVFSNFSARQGINHTFKQGGLTRFVEASYPGSLVRPSQFRLPPPVLQTYIRPIPEGPVADAPVADVPAAGFVLPVLDSPMQTTVLSASPLNAQLLAAESGPSKSGPTRLDLVLLRWATLGLAPVDNTDVVKAWDMPSDIELAHYQGAQREVIVLNSQSNSTIELELPDAYEGYLLISVNSSRQIIGTTLSARTVSIDSSQVILLWDPALN